MDYMGSKNNHANLHRSNDLGLLGMQLWQIVTIIAI